MDESTFPFSIDDMHMEDTTEDFKVSPNKVNEETYLSSKWNTKTIYGIPGSNAGVYLLYNLHKNPHYHLSQDERVQVKKKATSKGVTFKMATTPNYEIPDKIYHYTHESKEFENKILPIKNQFRIPEIISMLKQESISSRGNIAKSIGWKSISYEHHSEYHINIPKHDKLNELQKEIFKVMTKTFIAIFQPKLGTKTPFIKDPYRIMKYANWLVNNNEITDFNQVENIFESMTFAMTYYDRDSDVKLRNHIDRFNCDSDGFNAVFGIYFHTVHPENKEKIIRVVYLGYSRKSIFQCMHRLEKENEFRKSLDKYYEFLKSGNRLSLCLKNAFPFQSNDEVILKVPFIDKCGFYSIFVSAVYDFIQKFKHFIFLEDIIELILPIAYLTTGISYHKVLKEWSKKSIMSTENKAVQIIREIVHQFGGLSKGKGPRFQPSCNKPIDIVDIHEGLRMIKSVIALCNSNKFCNKDQVTIAMNMLMKVKHIGNMGAQHILAILTLLCIIHHPQYVQYTTLLTNSGTAKKLKTTYFLSDKLTNEIYDEVAKTKFDGCIRKVENLVCEFFRDFKDTGTVFDEGKYEEIINMQGLRFPDVFVHKQALFIEEDDKIFKHSYDEKGNVVIEELKELTFNSDDDRDWLNNQYDRNVQFIAVKSQITRPKEENIQNEIPHKDPENMNNEKQKSELHYNIRKRKSMKYTEEDLYDSNNDIDDNDSDDDTYSDSDDESKEIVVQKEKKIKGKCDYEDIQEIILKDISKVDKKMKTFSIYEIASFKGKEMIVSIENIVQEIVGHSRPTSTKKKEITKKIYVNYGD